MVRYTDEMIREFSNAYQNLLKSKLPKVSIPTQVDGVLPESEATTQFISEFLTDIVTSITVSLLETGDKATEIVKVATRSVENPTLLATFHRSLENTYERDLLWHDARLPGRLYRNYVRWEERVKQAFLDTYATL